MKRTVNMLQNTSDAVLCELRQSETSPQLTQIPQLVREHYQEILLTHNILVHYKCKVFTSLNLCASCELVQLFATVHLVLHYTKESFGILSRGRR